MDNEQNVYRKGDLVPAPGTYRCLSCGEIWTTEESNVRFPPCEVSKTGDDRWVRAESA